MWQPIHTAPNDETPVLTCFMADGQPRFQVVPAHMIHHVVSREDRVGMHQRDGSWPQPKRFYYSHWMPIPPPPSTDSK